MGYERHNAIVVSSWNKETLVSVHKFAAGATALPVSTAYSRSSSRPTDRKRAGRNPTWGIKRANR